MGRLAASMFFCCSANDGDAAPSAVSTPSDDAMGSRNGSVKGVARLLSKKSQWRRQASRGEAAQRRPTSMYKKKGENRSKVRINDEK